MTNVKTTHINFADFASQMARNPHTFAELQEIMDDAERKRDVSERIAALRKQRGMTQEQVARRMGAKLRTYQNWEAGHGTSGDNYEMLAEVLGSSLHYILNGGDHSPPAEDILTRLDALEAGLHRLQTELAATRSELIAEIGKVQLAPKGRGSTQGQTGRKGARKSTAQRVSGQ